MQQQQKNNISNNPYGQGYHNSPSSSSLISTFSSAADSSTHLLPPSPTTPTMQQSGNGLSGGRADVQAMFARKPPSLRSVGSKSTLNDTPYTVARPGSVMSTTSDKFSLAPDPASWGLNLSMRDVEPDDYLHNPDPRRDRKFDRGGTIFTARGFANLGCMIILALGMTMLFAGYPLISYFTSHRLSNLGGFGLGGTNASGVVPNITHSLNLVDPDTPDSAKTVQSYKDGSDMTLVFSDEFNLDGRTFYPGDDPYWEAVNLHYWQTGNLEWYDPSAITTQNGSLNIKLSNEPRNGQNYTGGMMSSWNKFCFTGGRIEVAVMLPGDTTNTGLWPAIWTMGNLGRAGYGASLDGLWPYTYDSCDVGTLANQTQDGLPYTATINGDPQANGELSYLPGQRLSACTCPGSSHPGPIISDPTAPGGKRYRGRAAPEIDIFEAQITNELSTDPTVITGQVSQSAQFAPFDEAYQWNNATGNYDIQNADNTIINPYMGGIYQQAASGVTETNQEAYELTGQQYAVYGIEYKPGLEADNAYITWIANGAPAWTLNAAAVGVDTGVEIGAREISVEPMYILANLGLSPQFAPISPDLVLPATMRVDYIRVYQPADQQPNYSCDPPDYPTKDYINQYMEAYVNPNLTTWVDDYKQSIPPNNFTESCPPVSSN